MKKYVSTFSAAILMVLAGCAHNQTDEAIKANESTTSVHSRSLDWSGVYFATLPCASCPGINTLLLLNNDGTFEKTTDYLGEDDYPETIKGKIEWSSDGKMMSFDGQSYIFRENQLHLLDADNKMMTGELKDLYVFKKTELEPSIDSNKGFNLQQFTDKKAEVYNVIFNTNSEVPTALLQTQAFEKLLTQTEAWAKGAEYKGEGLTLIVRGDKATLVIKGNSISLHRL